LAIFAAKAAGTETVKAVIIVLTMARASIMLLAVRMAIRPVMMPAYRTRVIDVGDS
jgi:hypothetical protein